MFATFAGLTTGLLHVLAGPDHLAAVAPLAAARGRGAWFPGLLWGLGHTTGVLLIGVLLVLLRDLLPLDFLSAYSERIVGLALVAIGLWAAVRAWRLRQHGHAHALTHHGPSSTQTSPVAFGMGVLHGFAGSSHLLGLLPALALPSQAAVASYVAGFGIGAVAAMTVFAWLIGLIAVRARRGNLDAYRWVLQGCAAAAVVVGGVWLMG